MDGEKEVGSLAPCQAFISGRTWIWILGGHGQEVEFLILKRRPGSNVSGLINQTHLSLLSCILLFQPRSSSLLLSLTCWCSIITTRTYFSCLRDFGLTHRSPRPATAGVPYCTVSLTHRRSNYSPEPRGLNSSALISQLVSWQRRMRQAQREKSWVIHLVDSGCPISRGNLITMSAYICMKMSYSQVQVTRCVASLCLQSILNS